MPRSDGQEHDAEVQIAPPELKPPSLYQVFLLNDDYTPMGFVVDVLRRFFYLSEEAAIHLMFQIHTTGKAICAVYTRGVAETKIKQVADYAKDHQYPLECGMEPTS